jgi:hypothetical protein
MSSSPRPAALVAASKRWRAALHPDRIPAHGDAGGKLRGLVVASQRLACVEQTVGEVPAGMEPHQRAFGEVDRHAARRSPPAGLDPRAARSFGGEFAFDQLAFHGLPFRLCAQGLAKTDWL